MKSETQVSDVAERLREILHYDPETGLFVRKISTSSNARAGQIAGIFQRATGYIRVRFDGRMHYAHRLVWLYQTGSWPSEMIDHINGIKNDNRFANLREATRSENQYNRKAYKNNMTGLKGVSWHGRTGRWQAKIAVGGKRKFIGTFDTPEEAHAAYAAAAVKFHGIFANPSADGGVK